MKAEELRRIRLDHELTQKAMAHMLGYNTHYICKLENGEVPISARLEKLVRAMLGKKRISPN